MLLNELDNGDVFCHANAKEKKPKRFVVYGNPFFNSRHGSSTRNCKNDRGELVGKSCRLEVKKIGVSLYAEKIKEMFGSK